MKLNSDSIESRWNQAVMLIRSGERARALLLLQSLANDGVGASYREIANLYEQPSGGGVEQDFEKAREWYKKSFELADDVRACIGLGRMYYYGKGCSRQPAKAFTYYSMVADRDIPEAHLMLGRMYSLGRGVAIDSRAAKSCYCKAIKGGNLIAYKDLALHKIANGEKISGSLLWLFAAIRIFYQSLIDPQSKSLRNQ